MSKRIKRITALVLIAILCMSCCTFSVFAASHRNDIAWLQAAHPTKTLNSFEHSSGQITFEGIANSVVAGEFTVVLQKKGLVFWSDMSLTYTVQQHCQRTYSLREGANVDGQYFKLYWPDYGSGTYRIVLKDPTVPQETGLYHVYY